MGFFSRLWHRRVGKKTMQTLYYVQEQLPADRFAVVRVSWLLDGKTQAVTEAQIPNSDDVIAEFGDMVQGALKAGGDVSIICSESASYFGLEQE